MTSHIGTLDDKPGWDCVSTNYTERKFRAPICRFLRPLCEFKNEYCIDACETHGYECKKLVNVARGKVITAPSMYSLTERDSYVVDGKVSLVKLPLILRECLPIKGRVIYMTFRGTVSTILFLEVKSLSKGIKKMFLSSNNTELRTLKRKLEDRLKVAVFRGRKEN